MRLRCSDKLPWNSWKKRRTKPDKSLLVSFLGWKGQSSEYETSTWRLWWLLEGGRKVQLVHCEGCIILVPQRSSSFIFWLLNASFVSADDAGNGMNSRRRKSWPSSQLNTVEIYAPEEDANTQRLLFPNIWVLFDSQKPVFYTWSRGFSNPPDTLSKAAELNVTPHLFCCTAEPEPVCGHGNFLSVLVR